MPLISSLPRPNPNVVWTPLPDGAVLFLSDTELYFGLNSVGTVVWQLLPPATQTLDELCAGVHARYPDATPEQIRDDVSELLEALLGHGLLVSGDDG